MTSRNRLLAALRHTGPDRIPWAPYIGGLHYQTLFPGEWQEAVRNDETERFASLRFAMEYHASVGGDYISWGAPNPFRQHQPNVKVSRYSEGAVTTVKYETPIGTLSAEECTGVGIDGVSYPYIRKHPIESPEDMRIYTYMVEDTEVTENYAYCRDWLDEVGESGVGLSSCETAPLKRLIQKSMSVEGMVFALQDHKKAFDRLVEAMHKLNLKVSRICADSPVTVFMDMAACIHMISPRIYREYCVPYSRAYSDILHERGKLHIFLTAGENFKAILPEIEQCGFDGIWGYEPTREGNASIADIRAAWGNRLCTGGGMFTDCLHRGSRREVIDMANWVLDQVQPDDRFVLSTSSIVVPGTPTENIAAVGEVMVERT